MTRRQKQHLIKKLGVLEARGWAVPFLMDNKINLAAMSLCDKICWMKRHPNKKIYTRKRSQVVEGNSLQNC
jgi:hypothetical protein